MATTEAHAGEIWGRKDRKPGIVKIYAVEGSVIRYGDGMFERDMPLRELYSEWKFLWLNESWLAEQTKKAKFDAGAGI